MLVGARPLCEQEVLDEGRLADACGTLDEHQPGPPGAGGIDRAAQRGDLAGPLDHASLLLFTCRTGVTPGAFRRAHQSRQVIRRRLWLTGVKEPEVRRRRYPLFRFRKQPP
ncbi:hypothetical protein [Streptomyces sp. 5-6(2022)]|uniref:hypothetical protein n=1 Tax=Streptomyces sp. 5-6(2022) TaxID=2936510 RepID=UPI0023B9E23F|nr:hypothetical protein [Streptomyces sp. 5-6(2022)]